MTRKTRHRNKRRKFNPKRIKKVAERAYEKNLPFWKEEEEKKKREREKRALLHYVAQKFNHGAVKRFLKKQDVESEKDWILLQSVNRFIEEINNQERKTALSIRELLKT